MVFFAAALVDAHAAVALGASVLGQPCVSAERGGSPLRRSKRAFARRAWPRCARGWRWESELEVYPPRYISGLSAGVKDFCEGPRTPGSIPYLSGRARLVGASKPTLFYFGSTPRDVEGPFGVAKGFVALEAGLRVRFRPIVRAFHSLPRQSSSALQMPLLASLDVYEARLEN